MALEVSIFERAAIRPEQTAGSKRTSVASGADGFGEVLSSTKEILRKYGKDAAEPGVEATKERARLEKSKEAEPFTADINSTAVKTDKEPANSAEVSVSDRDRSGASLTEEEGGTDSGEASGIGVETGKIDASQSALNGETPEPVSLGGSKPQRAYPLIEDEYGFGGAVAPASVNKEGKRALSAATATPEKGLFIGGQFNDVIEEPDLKPLLLGNGQEALLDNETAEVSAEATGAKQGPEAAGAALPQEAKVFAEATKASAPAVSAGVVVQSELEAGEQAYRINLASLLGGNGGGNGTDGQAGSLKAEERAGGGAQTAGPVTGLEAAIATGAAGGMKGTEGVEESALLTGGSETGSVPVDNGGLTGIAAPVAAQGGGTAAASSITGTGEKVSATVDGAVGVKSAALSPAGVNESAGLSEAEQEPLKAGKEELLQGEGNGGKGESSGGTEEGKSAVKDGLAGTGESLRQRTGQDAASVKRVVEQAEDAKVPYGKGNEAAVKAADVIDRSVKSIETGKGVVPGTSSDGGSTVLADLSGGGAGGAGEDGSSPDTPRDFSALLAREGQLKNVTVTQTYSSVSTGSQVAKGVEDTVKVYEKFAQAIKLSFLSGGKNVTLRLSPEHLGALQIKLQSDGKSVKAKVLVDSLAVKQLLESDSGKLKQLFAEQGMQMEEYSVALQEQSVGSGGSSGAELWQRRASGGGNSMSRKTGPDIGADNVVIHPAMNRAYGIGRDRGVDLFA